MPQRPGQHRPLGDGAESRAHRERQRERLALMPSPSERGYDRDWLKARASHLFLHPTCIVAGCDRPAVDVDHIESVRDAPHRRLDPSNFRSMCHEHHAQRTARDQGFARVDEKGQQDRPPRGARHPEWLRRVVVPLTVVCGPPGSGRRAYVRERAGPSDMVLDIDAIRSKLSRLPLYRAGAQWADPALRWRNSRLALLDHVAHRWPAAWLVLGEPRERWRQWWVDHVGAVRIVVLEVEPRQCFDEIEGDDERPPEVKHLHSEFVSSWWERYARRDGDMIIRPDARPFIAHGARHA
jgi:hypothetical protein